MGRVLIRNRARKPAPRLPCKKVAATLLPTWEISLVFIESAGARALNQALRGKASVPTVLSYRVGKRSGEIIICPAEAKRRAGMYGLSDRDFILYLFIHGLLHLKGYRHGATMERRERALLAKFSRSARRLYP